MEQTTMIVALIAAAARNGVIGRNNKLPWHLPQDLKYFKSVTLGKPVIMGRKTYESIGRPLPGRENIVVTRQSDWRPPTGMTRAGSLHEALDAARLALSAKGEAEGEVMVMGGGEIYRNSLALAQRVYLTKVDIELEGDAYFPELPASEWRLVSETPGESSAPIVHSFCVYERMGKREEGK
ncbi:dihydrofolate reductase [Marinimicrobium sp. ABcell2]|uniref:dihydrofolate reductase n=1 Tax=Marinimicrobium sp. ABcell2 TaxID=3069751 RepID=UPI0027B30B7C|nr:dihydrofolate reductase [Marinimicrobium sp. ABcell2]MDQ2076540.1 dihydrofolate reductase [Marinimicrobium sp. ABcell2]